MQLTKLPTELQKLLLCNTSLESIVALNQSCSFYREFFRETDDSVVRQKVQERIPWMELGQPGTGLATWLDAARLIVSRCKSFLEKPEKWLDSDEYALHQEAIKRNTNITYVDSVKIEDLPTSFKPMFTDTIYTPVGGLSGKYMDELESLTEWGDGVIRTVDVTTRKPVKNLPEPPKPTRWSGQIDSMDDDYDDESSVIMPISGVLLVNDKGGTLRALQENERWYLVELPEEGELYLLDKQLVEYEEEKSNSRTRHNFDVDEQEFVKCYLDSEYTFVHLLPGSTGVIVFEFGEQNELEVYFDDVGGNRGRILLTELTGNLEEYEEFFDESRNHGYDNDQGTRGTPRQLVVTYGGMLYLHLRTHVLIPLWVDFADVCEFPKRSLCYENASTVAVGGLRQDFKTLLLTPEPREMPVEQTYGIVRSPVGQWAMGTASCGRIVVNLSTQKSYVIRAAEEPKGEPFVFVGLNEAGDRPVFYRCTMKHRLSHMRKQMESDLFSFGLGGGFGGFGMPPGFPPNQRGDDGDLSDEFDTGYGYNGPEEDAHGKTTRAYLCYRDYTHAALDRCEPLFHTMVRPDTNDQNLKATSKSLVLSRLPGRVR